MSAFSYPQQSTDESSKSSGDQLNETITEQNNQNNAIINLTEGNVDFKRSNFSHYGGRKNISFNNITMPKKYKQKGSGRTINVPKVADTTTVPGPSFNGAVTIGEACVGGHCAVPVTPTTTNMIHNNLNSANPPPMANVHYPGTDRLGNATLNMPGISDYVGTKLKHGPFNIQCAGGLDALENAPYLYITNPASGRRVSIFGKTGKKVIKNYLIQLGGSSKLAKKDVAKFNRRHRKNINTGANKCLKVYGNIVRDMDKKPYLKPRKAKSLLKTLKRDNCKSLHSKSANKLMLMMESDEEYREDLMNEFSEN